MTSEAVARQPATADADHSDEGLELTFRCARPRCRSEFTRTVGVGRRRQYCSDICRGVAEKEYKQAKAALMHYERLLEQARADLAAFGRDLESGATASGPPDDARVAARARGSWDHARGVSEFASAGDPRILDVLRDLVSSVEPLVPH